jgi:hypothetical protein
MSGPGQFETLRRQKFSFLEKPQTSLNGKRKKFSPLS